MDHLIMQIYFCWAMGHLHAWASTQLIVIQEYRESVLYFRLASNAKVSVTVVSYCNKLAVYRDKDEPIEISYVKQKKCFVLHYNKKMDAISRNIIGAHLEAKIIDSAQKEV
eukprot:IDg10816t1